MSAECDKCGCNLIYGSNYPDFECQMCKVEEEKTAAINLATEVLTNVRKLNGNGAMFGFQNKLIHDALLKLGEME